MSDGAWLPEPGTIRIERRMPAPVERVWEHLVEPGLRATWFAGGSSAHAVGSTFELRYDHSLLSSEPIPDDYDGPSSRTARVTRFEPPRVLAFTWGSAGEVTIELAPIGDETLLVLTHCRLAGGDDAPAAAGWHAHLDVLEDRLGGGELRAFWAAYERLQAEYRVRFAGPAR